MTTPPNNDPAPVNLTVLDLLKELQEALPRELLERLKSGTATHQELAIIRQVLRDNGLTLVAPPADEDTPDTPADLPDFPKPASGEDDGEAFYP